MSEAMQKTLLALKDVHGIQGSFVLNGDGKLLALEMPSLFDASMFGDVGSRLERLSESLSSLGQDMESCMVRFADHILCVKQFGKGGSLCILSDSTVNLPALRMAINIAHRRLATEIATAAPIDPPPAMPAMPTAAQVAAAAVAASEPVVAPPPPVQKPVRMYRGHPVDD